MDPVLMDFLKHAGLHLGKHAFDKWMESRNHADDRAVANLILQVSATIVGELATKLGAGRLLSEEDFGNLGGVVYAYLELYLERLSGKKIGFPFRDEADV